MPLPTTPRPPAQRPPRSGQASTEYSSSSLHRRAQFSSHAPTNSNPNAQLLAILALAVTLAALLALAGVTLTAAFAALVVLSPLLLLTCPLWAPLALVAIVTGAASLVACSLAVAALGAGTWAYRYFAGRHLVGARRVDYYTRGRFAYAGGSHVATGYYGPGYSRRIKDVAPGA